MGVAPNAFLTPISLVRSVTDTSIIFIKAIEAPSSVINPIPKPEKLQRGVMKSIYEFEGTNSNQRKEEKENMKGREFREYLLDHWLVVRDVLLFVIQPEKEVSSLSLTGAQNKEPL